MTGPVERLSPRQRDCLRLVWDRQATSKEIAAALGISKGTVDGYIAEAVEQLGARDRREAALIAFGHAPPAASGGDPAGVAPRADGPAGLPASSTAFGYTRPWRSRANVRNTLSLAQTVLWIAIIAFGSLAALALAASVGNGLPPVAMPVIEAVRRLTH